MIYQPASHRTASTSSAIAAPARAMRASASMRFMLRIVGEVPWN